MNSGLEKEILSKSFRKGKAVPLSDFVIRNRRNQGFVTR
jgi:hypothetical protein